MSDFLIKRSDLRECRVAESEKPALEAGQALLRIDSFGLTANNVTYAVFGDAMSYWRFFEAPEGWGRMPVWGFAEVQESGAEGVDVGTRLYGYLPPSSHLVVNPGRVMDGGFSEASPHREALPSVYNSYTFTTADPFHREDTEAMQMLLRPLFLTSFLIDDQLSDDGLTGRGPVIISSASSKTAIATAFLLSRRDGGEVIGLTSPGNTGFVEGLGIYDRVITYDAIGTLEPRPASFVDIAGDAQVRQDVHARFADGLLHSMVVGATHWEGPPPTESELPGPPPTFFFAPARAAKRSEDWGRDQLTTRAADAWHPFCEWAGEWLEPLPGSGLEAARSAYLEVLEGRVDPKRAHVISLA